MFERKSNLIVFTSECSHLCLDIYKWELWKTIDLVKIASQAITDYWCRDSDITYLSSKLREVWIWCYLWWWVTEKWIKRIWLSYTIKSLKSKWVSAIEISRDDWEKRSEKEFKQLVRQLSQEFESVIVEIWTKEYNDAFSKDYKAWEESINIALESEADSVIIEWWMWAYWIFDKNSRVKTLLFLYLIRKYLKSWSNKEIIIETWTRKLQKYIISLLWPNVKLWNIPLITSELMPTWDVPYLNNLREDSKNTYSSNLLDSFFELIDIIFALCEENNIDPNYFFFSERFYDLDFDTEKTVKSIKEEISKAIQPKWSFIFTLDPLLELRKMWVSL